MAIHSQIKIYTNKSDNNNSDRLKIRPGPQEN